MNNQLLAGKRAVVSAGAKGMGRAIVLLLAAQGAQVAFCDIDDEAGQTTLADANTLQPGCLYQHCDMGNADEVDAFCQAAKRRLGHADVLVNVAGINDRDLLVEQDPTVFERILAVNLKGALRLSRAFVPGMAAAGGGSVIHISSVNSTASVPGNTAYAASKGGIEGMSRAIAMDYAACNVRSNVICPGAVYTGELRPWWEGRLEEPLDYPLLLAHQPLNGPGLADNIATTVLFLASDLSSYVTGATLFQDGGGTMQAHRVDAYPQPPDYEDIIEQYRVTLDKSRGGGP